MIRGALGLLAVAVATGVFWTSAQPGLRVNAKVVVVGAGLGGLSAAHRLQRAGFGDVTVLEARGKAGGRVWTHRAWGHPIDVGATFIHGVEGNPLTDLAAELRLETIPVDYSKKVVYGRDGTRISEEDMHNAKATYKKLRKSVFTTRDRLYKDAPLEQAFVTAREKLNVTAGIRSGVPAPAAELSPLEEALAWHFFWEIVQDQIADLRDLSTVEFDASLAFPGRDHVLKRGMGSLTDALAAQQRVVYNCTVRSVSVNTESQILPSAWGLLSGLLTGSGARAVRPVAVECEDNRLFHADVAVVALPLGVMQSGAVQFAPPLPKWKRRSIHRLGCSAAVKVALRFERVFWDTTAQFIGKIGRTGATSVWGRGNHLEFVNMEYFHPGSKTLVAEADVDYARHLGLNLSGDARVQEILDELKVIYGERNVAPLVEARSANFVKDPLVKCGFSYWPPFASGDDNLACAEALHAGRLHFVGEFTSPLYYGNLHGALHEGYRVADAIDAAFSPKASDFFSAAASLFSSPSQKQGKSPKRYVPAWCPAPCQV